MRENTSQDLRKMLKKIIQHLYGRHAILSKNTLYI